MSAMLSRILFAIILTLSTLPSLAFLPDTARAADENVIIVLDASGSMWGQIDGVAKIQIAREVMDGVLADLDGKAQIGVMTYGHRRKGDCGDIESLIPVGQVNRAAYMEKINALNPKGKTPITSSVRAAAEELRFTENKATVILVSDGLETCDADPCALARELEQAGIDFTAHVVGFDLKDEDTASLQCLASETGGRYLSADNADELGDAIGTVVAVAPEPAPEPEPAPAPEPEPASGPASVKLNVRLAEGSEPVDGAYAHVYQVNADESRGEELDRGSSRSPYEIEPGKVEFYSEVGAAEGKLVVDITPQTTEVDLILNAGLLKVSASEAEGGEANEGAYIHVYEPQADAGGKRNRITAGNQRNIFTLPAGSYYATATIGQATVGGEVEIRAGERVDLDLVLGSGYLQVQGTEVAGGEINRDVYINIYEAEAGTDGKRRRVTAGNTRNVFALPAGKYYVTGNLGRSTVGEEIEVKAGQHTDVLLVLGSGVMKVTAIPADGAKPLEDAYITIYEAEQSLDGSRTRIEGGNQNNQFKLPAGKYLVEAEIDLARGTIEVELEAGKRHEPVINLDAGALSVNGDKNDFVTVYAFEKNLDGTRDRLDTFRPGKPRIVPAGKYFLTLEKGDQLLEAEAEVIAGKLAEVSFGG